MGRSKRAATGGHVGANLASNARTQHLSQDDLDNLQTLYQSGQLQETYKRARKLMRRFPRALTLYDIVTAALVGQGKLAEATACCTKALKIDPSHVPAHSNLAVILRKLGKPDDAIASYERALAIDPDHPETRSNLGNALRSKGDLESALKHYQHAIDARPDFCDAQINLGHTYAALGRFEDAAVVFGQALKTTPNTIGIISCLVDALQHVKRPDWLAHFKDVIRLCFEQSCVDGYKLQSTSHELLKSDLRTAIESAALSRDDIADLDKSTDGLLTAHLKNGVIADYELEAFLSRIRRQVLILRRNEKVEFTNNEREVLLLRSLAYQGYLNEYVWHVSEEEQTLIDALETDLKCTIENGHAPAESDLYLLGAYRSLYAIDSIRSWVLEHHDRASAEHALFLQAVVLDREQERQLEPHIDRLTAIDDHISMAVRSQYEENPYPRWNSVTQGASLPLTEHIIQAIEPHRPALDTTDRTWEVLIAGSGTGRQPISSALHYKNATVLAVDLSRTSLAYAQRKARALGVQNVVFAQADILRLSELGRVYDVVECSGVLHHMADPEAGLKVLLDCLKPGGFLKLGLYSEYARREVVQARQLVAETGFEPTLEGIRAFRQCARANPDAETAALKKTIDFYATSPIRDLIFHVQEHRYTIPQISAMLEKHKLEFLGFGIPETWVKTSYRKRFPGDANCTDLRNWDLFEQDNPNIFSNMYQFWCQKPT